MVDYLLRPFAGLLLCFLIGAAIFSLPYVIRTVTAWVRDARTSAAGTDAPVDEEEAKKRHQGSAA